jgi:hypothetical protein
MLRIAHILCFVEAETLPKNCWKSELWKIAASIGSRLGLRQMINYAGIVQNATIIFEGNLWRIRKKTRQIEGKR